MKRYTRKHYNKKLVALGLACFMGIGLTSTGFAAWIMSKDTKNEPTGNVTVATIEDVNMEITVEESSIGSFVFDAAKDDNSGRIQWDGENAENLSITIKGTVTEAAALTSLTLQLTTLPEGIKKACGLVGEETPNYLVAPACVQEAIQLKDGAEENGISYSYDESSKIATFSYTITFEWGTAFNGMNPSKFYDEDEIGKAKSDEEVDTEMKAFRALLAGTTNTEEGNEYETPYTGSYVVTIIASARVQE